jgi:hypothetical protein
LKLKAKAIEPRSFILPVVSPKPFCQPSKMLAKTLLRRSIPSAVRSMCSVRLPVTSLSEEEEMFRSSVAKFAKDVIAPRVREMDENSHMDTAVLKGLFDNGLMGVETSPEMGGSGGSFMSACVVIEELAKVDPAVSVLCDVHNTIVGNMFRFWASEDLQSRYSERLATDLVGSFCLSEAGSGSDAFALQTRADKSADGTYYTINGTKMWITNAEWAGVFLCMANVDLSSGYKGITCFVVDRDTPGLTIGKKEDKVCYFLVCYVFPTFVVYQSYLRVRFTPEKSAAWYSRVVHLPGGFRRRQGSDREHPWYCRPRVQICDWYPERRPHWHRCSDARAR